MRTAKLPWLIGGLVALLLSAGVALAQSTTGGQASGAAEGERKAMSAYLYVDGGKTLGPITGPTGLGCDGCIPLLSYSHTVSTPRDAATGMATGKRQYQPLLIRKRVDKASPLLMQALVANLTLPKVTVEIDQVGLDGTPKPYFTYTLVNASVSSITADLDGDGLPEEAISFTFEKIIWTSVESGKTAQDDWSAPR